MFVIEPIHIVAVGIGCAIVVAAYAKHTINKLRQRNQPLKITN